MQTYSIVCKSLEIGALRSYFKRDIKLQRTKAQAHVQHRKVGSLKGALCLYSKTDYEGKSPVTTTACTLYMGAESRRKMSYENLFLNFVADLRQSKIAYKKAPPIKG